MRKVRVELLEAEAVKPLRVRPRVAAKLLGLEYQSLRELIMTGLFTQIWPDGRGRGCKSYLPYSEVEAFAFGGREAVAKLRQQAK